MKSTWNETYRHSKLSCKNNIDVIGTNKRAATRAPGLHIRVTSLPEQQGDKDGKIQTALTQCLVFCCFLLLGWFSQLIHSLSQRYVTFLKLDYLTKRLKLYAWLHELKELCHHFPLLSDFPLLKRLLRTTSRHKNRLVFCYWNFFL